MQTQLQNKNKLYELQRIASIKDGACLSDEYQGLKTKLIWQCKEGHRWLANPESIIYQHAWCPLCAGNKKLTMTDIHRIAKFRGGRCLSSKYINSKEKMLWECSNGHRWYATVFSIKIRNSWCPECHKMSKHKKLRS